MMKEELIKFYCPEYSSVVSILDQYSDYELGLLNNFPDDIDDLDIAILKAVQWDVIEDILVSFVDDWYAFFSEYETDLMDYCENTSFLSYHFATKAYIVSKDTIIEMLNELIDGTKYSVNEKVDFNEIISELNKNYIVKFCSE